MPLRTIKKKTFQHSQVKVAGLKDEDFTTNCFIGPKPLTQKEERIVGLYSRGLTLEQILRNEGVSPGTLKRLLNLNEKDFTYVCKLYDKRNEI